jgi:hypothetical protein
MGLFILPVNVATYNIILLNFNCHGTALYGYGENSPLIEK